ncbi:MAG: histidine phosphatase family protein [Rhodocyclaceae bacterium]|nr:histidine phosphatase family protein [Rhodocyclaceae bacterium]
MSYRLFAVACAGLLILTQTAAAQTAAPLANAPAKASQFKEILATAELLNRVQSGGYVLYLRHSSTDTSRPDRLPSVDLKDCSTQRPLSDEGRKIAGQVGVAIRKAKIPLSEIRISPLCRAKETAELAFPGQSFIEDQNLMYTANLTSEQKRPILANTRQLLSASVAAGKNRLLVAHAPNLMDLIGYFPKEATLVIFRPLGKDGFQYQASIPPGRWPALTH